jgi:hypothetical protein
MIRMAMCSAQQNAFSIELKWAMLDKLSLPYAKSLINACLAG